MFDCKKPITSVDEFAKAMNLDAAQLRAHKVFEKAPLGAALDMAMHSPGLRFEVHPFHPKGDPGGAQMMVWADESAVFYLTLDFAQAEMPVVMDDGQKSVHVRGVAAADLKLG